MAKPKHKLAPLPPSMNLFLDGPDKEKATAINDYVAEVASTFSVPTALLKRVFQYVKAGVTDTGDIVEGLEAPPSQLKQLPKIVSQLKNDLKKHLKNREEWDSEQAAESERQREAKEEARRADEKAKEEASELFGEKLAVAEKGIGAKLAEVDDNIVRGLGKKFKIDEDTGFVVVSTNATQEDYVQALANLSNTAWGTAEIASRAAEIEASVAFSYSEKFPDTWKNLYFNREDDLKRIEPNRRVLETLKNLNEKPFAKISVMRAALEIKVASKDDPKYLDGKKSAIKAFKQFQKENGRPPTQAETRELVKSVKEAYGITQEFKPEFIAIIRDDDGDHWFEPLYKEDLEDDGLSKWCAISDVVLTKDGRAYRKGEDGNSILAKLEKAEGATRKWLDKLISEQESSEATEEEEEAPKKKAPKKAAKKDSPKPKEETEDDPFAEDGESGDDGIGLDDDI